MSYVSLGNICNGNGIAPFQKEQTVLLSNYGGVGYAPQRDVLNPKLSYQPDARAVFKNAYYPQQNPYASSMCSKK
jgi:hypothetical protein